MKSVSLSMYYLEFVRCAHEGTRRIRDSMQELKLPGPQFSEREAGYIQVRVTLRNNKKQRRVWIDSDASRLVGEAVSRTLAEQDLRVVNFIAEHGKINVSQAARLLGLRWHTAKKRLKRLANREILVRKGRPGVERDSQSHYVLATQE